MAQRVIIPTPLRKFTEGAEQIEISGAATLKELIDRLDERCPGIRSGICDPSGELRRFINVYIDGEDVRFQDELNTSLAHATEITIIPAIAGG